MQAWCQREPLTRSFCSCLDAVRGDASQDAEELHDRTPVARSRLSVGEERRSITVMGERRGRLKPLRLI